MKGYLVIAVYLLLMNAAGLIMMWSDKCRSEKNKWRIRERTFFLVSILGGSIGTWAGMYVFHHKTRHWYFVVGMPLILVLQVVLFLYVKTKVM